MTTAKNSADVVSTSTYHYDHLHRGLELMLNPTLKLVACFIRVQHYCEQNGMHCTAGNAIIHKSYG